MSAQHIAEGRQLVSAMLESLTGCQEGEQRARAIHDTLLELIDISLNWNNLEATVDRLAGFAQGLAEVPWLNLEAKHWLVCLPDVLQDPRDLVAAKGGLHAH